MTFDYENYFRSMFSCDHITTRHWQALAIVGILMYIVIFHVIDSLGETVTNIQSYCLKSCSSDTCSRIASKGRGKNYFSVTKANPSDCIFTMWEFSHLVTHIFIGYFFNIQTSLVLSAGFEVFEYYMYDCGSYLDLGWNFIGFLIGNSIRYYQKNN